MFQAIIEIMAEFAKGSAKRLADEQYTFSSKRTKRIVYALTITIILGITIGIYLLLD